MLPLPSPLCSARVSRRRRMKRLRRRPPPRRRQNKERWHVLRRSRFLLAVLLRWQSRQRGHASPCARRRHGRLPAFCPPASGWLPPHSSRARAGSHPPLTPHSTSPAVAAAAAAPCSLAALLEAAHHPRHCPTSRPGCRHRRMRVLLLLQPRAGLTRRRRPCRAHYAPPHRRSWPPCTPSMQPRSSALCSRRVRAGGGGVAAGAAAVPGLVACIACAARPRLSGRLLTPCFFPPQMNQIMTSVAAIHAPQTVEATAAASTACPSPRPVDADAVMRACSKAMQIVEALSQPGEGALALPPLAPGAAVPIPSGLPPFMSLPATFAAPAPMAAAASSLLPSALADVPGAQQLLRPPPPRPAGTRTAVTNGNGSGDNGSGDNGSGGNGSGGDGSGGHGSGANGGRGAVPTLTSTSCLPSALSGPIGPQLHFALPTLPLAALPFLPVPPLGTVLPSMVPGFTPLMPGSTGQQNGGK